MGGLSRRNGSNAWGASLAFAAAVLLAASPAPASPSAPAPPPEKPRLTGRAVVQVEPARRPQRVRERLSATLGAAGLRSEAVIPELGAAAVDIPRGWSVAALRRGLAGEPGVVRVTPEYRRSPRLAPLISRSPSRAASRSAPGPPSRLSRPSPPSSRSSPSSPDRQSSPERPSRSSSPAP